MEKERRLNATGRALTDCNHEAEEDAAQELEELEAQAARIEALQEEKRRFVDSATEQQIRDVLFAQPASVDPPAPKKGSLLEWAQELEGMGRISASVSAQIEEDHAAVDATGRLANVVAKDNDVLVRDFLLEERRQKLRTEQTGEKPSQPERLMRKLEKAGLRKDPQRADVLEQARAAFAVFDKDGDGKITNEEFREAISSGESLERAAEMFGAADTDGNGSVDFGEFVAAFTQKGLRPPGWVNPAQAVA